MRRGFNPLLMIHVDELSEALYWGVTIHALTQSIADLTDIVRRENARRLLDNFNTQLFFRVNDLETSKYVAAKAGSRTIFSRIFAGGAFGHEHEPSLRSLLFIRYARHLVKGFDKFHVSKHAAEKG